MAYAPLTQATEPATLQLVFLRDGMPAVAVRPAGTVPVRMTVAQADRVSALAQAVVNGPTADERARGFSSALPDGTTLGKIDVTPDKTIRIHLDLPPGWLGTPKYSPGLVEGIAHQFHGTLREEGLRNYYFYVKDSGSGSYMPIRSYLPKPKAFVPEPDNAMTDGTPPAPAAAPSLLVAPPAPPSGQITGALSGKAVVLNQAHGWLDDTNGWRVQRSKLYEQLEDYSSNEFLSMFLVPQLLNCGARVQPGRECDMQTNMAIVDNAQGAPAYAETGTWNNSTANGFINKTTASWNGVLVNPFGNTSATRYATVVSGAATATATYTPTIPAAGYYNVYISYSSGSNRTTQAHWQVYHTGGLADFRINEQRDGATWVLIGNFYFAAGANPATGKVAVLNDAPNGSIVSCDAVRFGGGMGDVARRTHGVSGKARWQEECVNYLNYLGGAANGGPLYYDNTTNYDDEELGWSDRPAYASWEQSRDNEGNDTIYIGFHTNAYNGGCSGGTEQSGAARGTDSFRDVDADATAGTKNLTTAVHNAVISNLKAFYDSSWSDRGITGSNSYGECSQSNLGTVSGFFLEALFADNTSDVAAWKDPKFRFAFARGITQGIISYYGGTTFPPEAPTNFRVKNIGNGQVRLDWAAGPVRDASHPCGSAATGYRVHTSTNGYGFDSGTITAPANYTFTLTPGQLMFFRVSAYNSAGVSIPTETLAARVTAGSQAQALVVNGSHRFDRYLPRLVAAVMGCANNLVRKIDWRNFQSFNYIIQHGKALSNFAISFDSCSAECVEAGQASLTPYGMIDWIGAQEAEVDTEPINTDDTAIKPNSRAKLQNYLQAGGKVFMSNSQLAFDFNRDTTKKAFLNNYMKASYVNDDANTYQALGASGGIFAGITTFSFDDGTGDTYDVSAPDTITAYGGSTVCMTYAGGSGGTAGIQYTGIFGGSSIYGRLVYLGFGFETIRSESVRNTVMGKILNYFSVTTVGEWNLY